MSKALKYKTMKYKDFKLKADNLEDETWESIRRYFIMLKVEHAEQLYAIILRHYERKGTDIDSVKQLPNFSIESEKGGIRCKNAKKLDAELQSEIMTYILACLDEQNYE